MEPENSDSSKSNSEENCIVISSDSEQEFVMPELIEIESLSPPRPEPRNINDYERTAGLFGSQMLYKTISPYDNPQPSTSGNTSTFASTNFPGSDFSEQIVTAGRRNRLIPPSQQLVFGFPTTTGTPSDNIRQFQWANFDCNYPMYMPEHEVSDLHFCEQGNDNSDSRNDSDSDLHYRRPVDTDPPSSEIDNDPNNIENYGGTLRYPIPKFRSGTVYRYAPVIDTLLKNDPDYNFDEPYFENQSSPLQFPNTEEGNNNAIESEIVEEPIDSDSSGNNFTPQTANVESGNGIPDNIDEPSESPIPDNIGEDSEAESESPPRRRHSNLDLTIYAITRQISIQHVHVININQPSRNDARDSSSSDEEHFTPPPPNSESGDAVAPVNGVDSQRPQSRNSGGGNSRRQRQNSLLGNVVTDGSDTTSNYSASEPPNSQSGDESVASETEIASWSNNSVQGNNNEDSRSPSERSLRQSSDEQSGNESGIESSNNNLSFSQFEKGVHTPYSPDDPMVPSQSSNSDSGGNSTSSLTVDESASSSGNSRPRSSNLQADLYPRQFLAGPSQPVAGPSRPRQRQLRSTSKGTNSARNTAAETNKENDTAKVPPKKKRRTE
ncbi:serine/arginine repetitive matrix protein 1-like isoform X2 [Agrilus planipennis]|uniref:Serine/arginine repetitive matrix protein 1-like isoform X2 n=1 Tax=Agrilus planipennis TaxID=224129 RepID=A0A1W4WSX6_AGRPL|nr:serine/arginine repetitive matrix protein 1-like isoform X2 [Agrilus planipennis]